MFIVSRVRRPVTRHHVCVKNVRCAAGACYPISGFSSRLARRQFPCVVRPPSRCGASRAVVGWSRDRDAGCAWTKKRIHTGYREKRKRKEVLRYTAPRGRSDADVYVDSLDSPRARDPSRPRRPHEDTSTLRHRRSATANHRRTKDTRTTHKTVIN